MKSGDALNTTEQVSTPDGDNKETPIDMTADLVRQMVGDTIRTFLKGHTVVIWGSGATVPLGFPTMENLLEIVSAVPEFNGLRETTAYGFEAKLSCFFAGKTHAEREVFEDKACKILGEVFQKCETEEDDKSDTEYREAMYNLYSFLQSKDGNPNRRPVDILTTNYDCAWERLCNHKGIRILDGFSADENGVDYSNFFDQGFSTALRLVKIHGSDNWFRYNTKNPYTVKVRIGTRPKQDEQCMSPKIIIPSNLKYEVVSKDTTFSNLMIAFGRLVKEADSYLTIGFGFNDLHLTPLLEQEAMKGKPVVRLMKEMTRGGEVFAESLPNILTITNGAEQSIRNTCVHWRKDGKPDSRTVFHDNLWRLPSFMKLLNDVS